MGRWSCTVLIEAPDQATAQRIHDAITAVAVGGRPGERAVLASPLMTEAEAGR